MLKWFLLVFLLIMLIKGCLEQVVSGIALPSGSDKLYTGSTDETVRVWDCQSGQVAFVFNLFFVLLKQFLVSYLLIVLLMLVKLDNEKKDIVKIILSFLLTQPILERRKGQGLYTSTFFYISKVFGITTLPLSQIDSPTLTLEKLISTYSMVKNTTYFLIVGHGSLIMSPKENGYQFETS